ncbi:GIY-YIG nuclease family protein [Oceanibaculum nanhaiense]|uniref:GIY-YIG nuclease family protein n=1 Tax=Oceanibaculum nanhaiense TaxID=1909734 RepID=UPI00396D1578
MQYFTYILASRPRGTLYVGITNDLVRRVHEHRQAPVDSFTKRYGVGLLVNFEQHATAEAAIRREKTLKSWQRVWKVQLIETANPDWRDLYPDIL